MNKEITALLLAAAAGAAHAQTVYRCGNTYSQHPCAGARTVAVEDARTPQQAAQSTASTRRDADLADAMEKQRLEEEKRAPVARVMGAGAASAGKAEASGAKEAKQKRKPSQQPAVFTAVAPGKPAAAKAKAKKSSS